MNKWYKMALAALLVWSAIGLGAAYAEEADTAADSGEEQEAEDFYAGLEVMENSEMAFKLVKLEVVAANSAIPDDHFKAVAVFQNTSPYTINNPATTIEIVDAKLNSVAVAKLKPNMKLNPGQSKWAAVEFKSDVEVTAGQSVKGLKAGIYDALYGERVDDQSELTGKGVYVFVNDKQLKAKVSDPSGYQYVPVKNLFELMGFKYAWDAKTSTFTAVKGKVKIENKIGNRNMKVNGKIVKLDGSQTAMINKTPMIAIDAVSAISGSWMLTKGLHEDITVIALADLEAAK